MVKRGPVKPSYNPTPHAPWQTKTDVAIGNEPVNSLHSTDQYDATQALQNNQVAPSTDEDAIQSELNRQAQRKPNPVFENGDTSTKNIFSKAEAYTGENIVKPLVNSFDDMIYGTAHGVTQITRDIVDNLRRSLGVATEAENDPMASSDFFSEQQKTIKSDMEKAYPSSNPTDIVKDILRSSADAVPTVIMTLASGGESLGWDPSILGTGIKEAVTGITKTAKLGTLLGATEGAEKYGEARSSGKNVRQSSYEGFKGLASGFGSAISLETQGLLGEKFGKTGIGLLKKYGMADMNGFTKAGLKSLAVTSVFASTPMLNDIIHGNSINIKEALENAGVGLLLSYPELEKAGRKELVKKLTDIRTKNAWEDFLKAPVETLHKVYETYPMKESAEVLHAQALHEANEAFENNKDPKDRDAKLVSAIALNKTADLKDVMDHVVDHKDEIIQNLREKYKPELDEDGQPKLDSEGRPLTLLKSDALNGLIQKINQVYENNNPVNRQLKEYERQIEENKKHIENLKNIQYGTDENGNLYSKLEIKKSLILQNDLEARNKNLDSEYERLLKGKMQGTIGHADGQVLDPENPQTIENYARLHHFSMGDFESHITNPQEAKFYDQNREAIEKRSAEINENQTVKKETDQKVKKAAKKAAQKKPLNEEDLKIKEEHPEEFEQTVQDLKPDYTLGENETLHESSEPKSAHQILDEYGIHNDHIFYEPLLASIENNGTGNLEKFIAENGEGLTKDEVKDAFEKNPEDDLKTALEKAKIQKEQNPEPKTDKKSPYTAQTHDGKSVKIDPKDIHSFDSPAPAGIFQDASWRDRGGDDPVEFITSNKPPKMIKDIFGDLAKSLELYINTKRIKFNKSKGPGNYNQRLRQINVLSKFNTPVVSHEIGHFIDNEVSLLRDDNKSFVNLASENLKTKSDLKKLSNKGRASEPPENHPDKEGYKLKEGFAEFIRKRILSPEATKKRYPELEKLYQEVVDNRVKAPIEIFSTDIRTLEGATIHQQFEASRQNREALLALEKAKKYENLKSIFNARTQGGLGSGKFELSGWEKTYASLFDERYPVWKAWDVLRKLLDMPGKELDYGGTSNFEKAVKVFAGVGSKITHIFSKGLIDASGKFKIDELSGSKMTLPWILGALDKKSPHFAEHLKMLENLLQAQRTVELANLFAERDGFTKPGVSEKQREEAKAKYHITGQGAGLRSDYLGAKKMLETIGQMDPLLVKQLEEGARRYREYNKALLDYAVEKGRISAETRDALNDTQSHYVTFKREDVVGLNKKDLLLEIEGGQHTLRDIWVSLGENMQNFVYMSDKNELWQTFTKPLLDLHFSQDEVEPNHPVHTIGQYVGITDGRKNVKTVIHDGVAHKFLLNEDIYNSIENYDKLFEGSPAQLKAVITLFKIPGQILRGGITHTLPFAINNIIKDYIERVIKSPSGYIPFLSDIQNLMEGGRPSLDRYYLSGADQSGHYFQSPEAWYKAVNDKIKKMTGEKDKAFLPMVLQGGKAVWDGYTHALEWGERLNRLPEFEMSYKKAIKDGLPPEEAMLHAAYSARNLMDFAVHGSLIKYVNQFIPFVNADFQGKRRTVEEWNKGDRISFALRSVSTLIVPAILANMYIHYIGQGETEETRAAWDKDMFLFLGKRNGVEYRIPRPYELGLPAAYANRLMDQIIYGDKNAWDDVGQQTYNTLMPNTQVPLYGTILQARANYNDFTNNYIVPPWEVDAIPELREGMESASELSKFLSNRSNDFAKLVKNDKLFIDPRTLDFAFRSVFGRAGDMAIRASNIGSKTSTSQLSIAALSGAFKDYTANTSRDVTHDIDQLKQFKMMSSPDAKDFLTLLKEYHNVPPGPEKDKLDHYVLGIAKVFREVLDDPKLRQYIIDKEKEKEEAKKEEEE